MDFKTYYAALLRHRTRTQPHADEALRDYQAVLNSIWSANIAA